MARLRQYDPGLLLLLFGGVTVNNGISSGTFFTVKRSTATWRHVKGLDGESIRIRTTDESGVVTANLQSSSQTNSLLAGLAVTDYYTGAIVVPLTLEDFGGTALYKSPVAYIETFPDADYADTLSDTLWSFICDPLLMFNGGNLPILR